MRRAWHVLRDTIDKWSKDNASAQAAALAYYSAFSIAPLILIAIAVAGAIFGEQAATGEIQRQLTGLLGDDAAKAVEALVVSAHRGGHGQLAAIIGTIALVLGATGVFVQLQDSLNLIWRASPAKSWMGLRSFLKKRLLSLAMVLAIGFLLLTSLLASAILSALGNYMSGVLPEWQVTLVIVNQVVSLAVIGFLFAVMFRYLPDHHVPWHAAIPPAVVSAALFTLGKFAIGLYLGHSAVASSFGAAGSLAVVLVWVYYSAQILLFGAEMSWVLAQPPVAPAVARIS